MRACDSRTTLYIRADLAPIDTLAGRELSSCLLKAPCQPGNPEKFGGRSVRQPGFQKREKLCRHPEFGARQLFDRMLSRLAHVRYCHTLPPRSYSRELQENREGRSLKTKPAALASRR